MKKHLSRKITLAQLTQLVESGVPVFLSSRIYRFERFLDVLCTKFVVREVGSVTVDARRYWMSKATLDSATRELTTKWLIDSVDIEVFDQSCIVCFYNYTKFGFTTWETVLTLPIIRVPTLAFE